MSSDLGKAMRDKISKKGLIGECRSQSDKSIIRIAEITHKERKR
jgi:hypothetical protein